MNLKILLPGRLMNLIKNFAGGGTKISKWLIFAFLAVSFLGFLDAAYLAAKHYLGAIPPCFISTGCQTVLTSDYSVIFGMPVALFGAVYYLLIFLLSVISLDAKKEIIYFAFLLAPLGFLASIYLVFLQIFVIKEICSYCLFSAAASTMLLILVAIAVKQLFLKNE